MNSSFDPYYKWLAIPPKDQPPNHYRLLALELFETDRDVIATAADQRMMLVRSFQSGDNLRFSQQLLNEIAAARLALLDANKKAVYDSHLRLELGASLGDMNREMPLASVPPLPPRPGRQSTVQVVQPSRKANKVSSPWVRAQPNSSGQKLVYAWVAGGAVALLILVAIVLAMTGGNAAVVPQPVVATPTPVPPQHRIPPANHPTPPIVKQPDAEKPPVSDAQFGKPEALRLRRVAPLKIDAGKAFHLQLETEGLKQATDTRFALGAGAPRGMTLDPQTGVLSWVPGDDQGPGTYEVEVSVNRGMLQDELKLLIEVVRVNVPPSINVAGEFTVAPGTLLEVPIAAIDANRPPQPLRFQLVNGPPDSMLDAETGKFTWTPAADMTGQLFEARVRVVNAAGGEAAKSFVIKVSGQPLPPEPLADKREPVPEPARLRAAAQRVHKLFQDELKQAAANPSRQLELAKKLMQTADSTANDPDGRFALYRLAMQQARAAGDVNGVMMAIRSLARSHQVDAAEEQERAAVELGKDVRTEAAVMQLAAVMITLLDEAIEAEDWDRGMRLARVLGTVASKTRDGDWRKWASTRGREINILKTLSAESERAGNTLEQNPDQPAAHRAFGVYRALVRGDWEQGLKHLRIGDDIDLAAAAKKELQRPGSPEELKSAADAWANISAQTHASSDATKAIQSSPWMRKQLRKHALELYQSALPQLEGLAKRDAEQQISKLRKDEEESLTATEFGLAQVLVQLDKQYGFYASGPYTFSAYPNTKWIRATRNLMGAKDSWYVISADGHLRAWVARNSNAPQYGVSLGFVGRETYERPALIHEAYQGK